jgi:hypothetical protein
MSLDPDDKKMVVFNYVPVRTNILISVVVCGAESISFGSGSTEPQIQIAPLTPASAPDSFIRYHEKGLFD